MKTQNFTNRVENLESKKEKWFSKVFRWKSGLLFIVLLIFGVNVNAAAPIISNTSSSMSSISSSTPCGDGYLFSYTQQANNAATMNISYDGASNPIVNSSQQLLSGWTLEGAQVAGYSQLILVPQKGSIATVYVFVDVVNQIVTISEEDPCLPRVTLNYPSYYYCSGTVNMAATVKNLTTPIDYEWFLNGSSLGHSTDGTYSYNLSEGGSAVIKVIASKGSDHPEDSKTIYLSSYCGCSVSDYKIPDVSIEFGTATGNISGCPECTGILTPSGSLAIRANWTSGYYIFNNSLGEYDSDTYNPVSGAKGSFFLYSSGNTSNVGDFALETKMFTVKKTAGITPGTDLSYELSFNASYIQKNNPVVDIVIRSGSKVWTKTVLTKNTWTNFTIPVAGDDVINGFDFFFTKPSANTTIRFAFDDIFIAEKCPTGPSLNITTTCPVTVNEICAGSIDGSPKPINIKGTNVTETTQNVKVSLSGGNYADFVFCNSDGTNPTDEVYLNGETVNGTSGETVYIRLKHTASSGSKTGVTLTAEFEAEDFPENEQA